MTEEERKKREEFNKLVQQLDQQRRNSPAIRQLQALTEQLRKNKK